MGVFVPTRFWPQINLVCPTYTLCWDGYSTMPIIKWFRCTATYSYEYMYTYEECTHTRLCRKYTHATFFTSNRPFLLCTVMPACCCCLMCALVFSFASACLRMTRPNAFYFVLNMVLEGVKHTMSKFCCFLVGLALRHGESLWCDGYNSCTEPIEDPPRHTVD